MPLSSDSWINYSYSVGNCSVLEAKALTLIHFTHTILDFDDPREEPFENIVGKGENAGGQQFLLIPCFRSLSPAISLLEECLTFQDQPLKKYVSHSLSTKKAEH